ncbi:hypothetical protein FRB95_009980 [Tulasnella sp. JGI-2019a]|nr:hypothetical protein FRB95_009980 [Tulasnella sp. JGI-2019a]
MSTRPATSKLASPLLVLLCIISQARAHEHAGESSGPYENNFLNDEPIDGALKWHIGIQMIVWGIVFPIGMVMGITRNKWHVPVQTFGIVATLFGFYLGHHHGGREFHTTAHAHFGSYLFWYLITQASLGIFLKAHVWQESRFRRVVVIIHGIIGKSFPVVGWIQMIFGGIAALGFCFGEHTIQCVAHFMMGSAFIAYGIILLIMLRVGAGFLARKGCSQEFLDSCVITLWGIINTFTEHDFLQKSSHWSHKDMQHVSLGVLWWAGGSLGIFLSRNGKRSVVPGVIIAMTGYAMSAHDQALMFSMAVHKVFGYALMAGGVTRVIEICFVLRDAPTPPDDGSTPGPSSFQHLPPYLLTLSGLTFLSATEEQMSWVNDSGMDHVTYTVVLFSGSFVIYLAAGGVLAIYEYCAKERGGSDVERGRRWPSFFPGSGRRLGRIQTDDLSGGYEALPLTAASDAFSPDVDRRIDRNRDRYAVHSGVKHTDEDGEVVFEAGQDETGPDIDHNYNWRGGN